MLSEYFGDKALNKSPNLDTIVAEGATIYAGILEKKADFTGMSFKDVIPYSLGLFVTDNKNSVFIKKNTQFPHETTRKILNSFDN